MKVYELMNELKKLPSGDEVRAVCNADNGQAGTIWKVDGGHEGLVELFFENDADIP